MRTLRTFGPLLLLALAFSACQCGGPEAPTPVLFRLKNTSQSPVYVDASESRMGLKVKRRVGGEWISFVEEPPCECLSCELVCGGCECPAASGSGPAGSPKVMKIEPGGIYEREWLGQVQMSGHASCQSSIIQGPECLRAENPPINETFRLELCYAPSATSAAQSEPDVPVPGSLPAASVLCVERPFQVQDGVVEINPERGAACSAHSDCKGEGELCFAGGCTRACPEMGYPELGGAWQVRIPEPDDQGFFAWNSSDGVRSFIGTGTVGAVRYENDTMTLTLRRQLQGGGTAVGTVYVTLPRGVAAPLTIGETVHVTLVDASTDRNPDNRGILIREGSPSGTILLAAETAQKGSVLRADLTSPLLVSRASGEAVGCRHTECGQRLHHQTRFAFGDEGVTLDPGKTADVVADAQVYRMANVGNARYANTHCTLDDVMPWAVVNLRP